MSVPTILFVIPNGAEPQAIIHKKTLADAFRVEVLVLPFFGKSEDRNADFGFTMFNGNPSIHKIRELLHRNPAVTEALAVVGFEDGHSFLNV